MPRIKLVKDYILRVRLDSSFRQAVETIAYRQGLDVSSYIRTLIAQDLKHQGYEITRRPRRDDE